MMQKYLRTEYVFGLILFILTIVYGIWENQQVDTVLGLIISSMFVSKGLTDFKKNNGGK